MSALLDLFSRRSFENPQIPISGANIADYFAGSASVAGPAVTEQSALCVSAVFSAIRVRAESLAVMPIKVYKVNPDGTKEEARNHPVWRLLHGRPNPHMSPNTFKKTTQSHLDGWGNGRARILYDGARRPNALVPLRPDLTEPMRVGNGEIAYKVTPEDGGSPIMLDSAEVIDVPGLGFDGLRGYSILREQAKQSIGTSLARQEFGGRFFKNGAWFAGALKHPGSLSPEARKALRSDLASKQGGALNAFTPMLLQEGMEWQQVGLPTEDAMLLELGVFGVRDIARFYRVPLHMLADMEKGASFASVEQMSLEFVTFTLGDPIRAWEEELTFKLLGPGYKAEFVTEALLRGDTKSRYEAYTLARNGGWMSVNDIRRADNMSPIEGGDEYLRPLNMGVVGEPDPVEPEPEPPEPEDEPEEDSQRILDAHHRLLRDTCGKLVAIEVDRARRNAKNPEGFAAWMPRFYDKHVGAVRDLLSPVADTITVLMAPDAPNGDRAEATLRAVGAFATDECRGACNALANASDISELLDRWDVDRPTEMAERLATRLKELNL